MTTQDGDFLRRWARRKREAAKALPGTAAATAPRAELPPLETLHYDSDFGAFMRGKVEESVRRAALKKLFSDPRFNIMDGLDIYIDDYSKEDPIPPGLLAQLEHARTTLFGPVRKEGDSAEAGTPPPQSSSDAQPELHCETQHGPETKR